MPAEQVISAVEIIKLRRDARFFRAAFNRFVNIFFTASIFFLCYFFREDIHAIWYEVAESYKFVYVSTRSKLQDLAGIMNSPIEKIEFAGLRRLREEDLIPYLYFVDNGGNVAFKNSVREMSEDMKKLQLVQNITINRVPAAKKIIVQVKERDLIASVHSHHSRELLLLDSNGEISDIGSFSNRIKDLIKVYNINYYEDFLTLYRYLHYARLNDYIKVATFVSDRRWNLEFKNGLLVKLPAKNWRAAIDFLIKMDQRIRIFSDFNKIVYVDLRVPNKLFIR